MGGELLERGNLSSGGVMKRGLWVGDVGNGSVGRQGNERSWTGGGIKGDKQEERRVGDEGRSMGGE